MPQTLRFSPRRLAPKEGKFMRGDENIPEDCKLAMHATRKLAEELAPEFFTDDNTRDW
jgi:hypothetical protein